MTIQSRLAELRELCDRATEGPWVLKGRWATKSIGVYQKRSAAQGDLQICKAENRKASLEEIKTNNLELIAESRTALPQLIEALEVAMEFVESQVHWDDRAIQTKKEIEQILKCGESE